MTLSNTVIKNLEIVGIPVQKDEKTNAIVQEVAKLLKVIITASDISTSHRLQTKNELKLYVMV